METRANKVPKLKGEQRHQESYAKGKLKKVANIQMEDQDGGNPS